MCVCVCKYMLITGNGICNQDVDLTSAKNRRVLECDRGVSSVLLSDQVIDDRDPP
jgi:hypothetical protein